MEFILPKSINQIIQNVKPIISREGINLISVSCSNCNSTCSTFKLYSLPDKNDKRLWLVCQICNYGFKCKNFHLAKKPDFGIILNQMLGDAE